MLRFATRPDKALTEIVTHCLEVALGILRDDSVTDDGAMACFYERLGVIFSRDELAKEIESLLAAHRSNDLYMPTEYHWLILHDVLHDGAEMHNDMVAEFGPAKIGCVLLGEIDFDAVADIYFWDEDFLLEPEALNDMHPTDKNGMGFTDGTFAVVNQLKPHPEDLVMRNWPVERGQSRTEFYRRGKKYPQCDAPE